MAAKTQKWDWPLQHNDGMVNIVNTGERFEADLEMPSFKANEIDVKVMKDELVVHCSQQTEGNRMPREIHRTYHLPPDVDLNSIKTNLRPNGLLNVSAIKKRK